MSDAAKKPSFEDRLSELNALIQRLEKGELGLEEAIQMFERGKRLHGDLVSQLAEFERRIETLTRDLDGQDRATSANIGPDGGDNVPF